MVSSLTALLCQVKSAVLCSHSLPPRGRPCKYRVHITKGDWGRHSLYRTFIYSEQIAIRCSHCKHTNVQSQHTRAHTRIRTHRFHTVNSRATNNTHAASLKHSHTVTAEQRRHQSGICSDKHRRKIKKGNSLAFLLLKKKKEQYFCSTFFDHLCFFFFTPSVLCHLRSLTPIPTRQ